LSVQSSLPLLRFLPLFVLFAFGLSLPWLLMALAQLPG
jgi:hypothetical protein